MFNHWKVIYKTHGMDNFNLKYRKLHKRNIKKMNIFFNMCVCMCARVLNLLTVYAFSFHLYA